MATYRYPKSAGKDSYEYKGKVLFRLVDEQLISDRISEFFSELNLEAAADADIDTQSEYEGKTNITFESGDLPIDTDAGSVRLYLPQAISFRDGAEYQNIELGQIGGLVEAGAKAGNVDVIQSALGKTVDEYASLIESALKGNTDTLSLQAVRAASKAGSEIGGAVRSAARITTNPNNRALFRSIALREFAFQFKLIASSSEEAEEIKSIIKFFRQNLYPEQIAPGGLTVGYKFPARFQIDMKYNDTRVATRILPSYLRDVSVTYNASSMGMHSDGNFTEVDISLAFTESRALTKNEVVSGGY